MSRRSRWLAAAALLVLAAVAFEGRAKRKMLDFEVYRTAGTRVVAGESLYRTEDGHWQFKYLPAFAFLVAPLARLPVVTARAIWFGISIALLVVLLNRSWRLLPDRRRTASFVVGLTIIALGKFYVREVGLGQGNLLLAVVVLLAVAQWRAGRNGAAGALVAAATVVKPYAIIFLPYLLGRRRFRAAGVFLLALLLAVWLPALRYGLYGNVQLLRGWWATVTTSTAPNLIGQDNISIAGMFAVWLGVGPVASALALATAALLVAVCSGVLLRRAGVPFPEYLDAAVLLLLMPLLSPQGWDYVLLVSTPAVMLILDRLDEFAKPQRWLAVACLALAGLTFWDVMGRDLFRAFMMSRIITVCALIEVGLVLRLRTLRAA